MGDLCLIYIKKSFRKIGYGTKVLKKLIPLLKKNGIEILRIEIEKNNFVSQKFFKKFNADLKSYLYEIKIK